MTPEAGKALFVQVGCASCHKVGTEGSATGPDLTLAGLRHSTEWLDLWLKDPQAWKPGTLMPNRRMPASARKAIALYLAEQKGQGWAESGKPWDSPSLKTPLEKGRVIYARAGCVACHGFGGKGGYPNPGAVGGAIPALNKAYEGFTKAELAAKIRAGVPEPQKADPNGPAPMVRMPSWGGYLTPAEIDAVAEFVLSLRPGEAAPSDW